VRVRKIFSKNSSFLLSSLKDLSRVLVSFSRFSVRSGPCKRLNYAAPYNTSMFVEKVERIAELPRDMSGDRAVSRAGGGVDGRATRFTREVRMAEELLARELGPDWRSKINELSREERLQLAKKLHAMGISNAPAITRTLRLSGRELRALCQAIHDKPANPSTGQKDVGVSSTTNENNIKTLDIQQSKPIMDKDSTWPHNLHYDQHVYNELLELRKKIDAFAGELDEVKTRLARVEEEEGRLMNMLARITEIPSPQLNVKGELSLGELFEKYSWLIECAKALLEKLGYRVERDGFTREEVQRLIEDERRRALEELNPDELKAILERRGYKVLEPPKSWKEVEELIEKARREGYEMGQNDKKIEAVKAIIERAVDSITSMFAPAIKAVMAGRASAPTSATGDNVASTTSNTQQSSQTASDSSS
jgi:hypothetical protein